MRAKLAQRQTGGTNPPESVAAVVPALLEPRTQETPSGGAEPLPGFVEVKPGLVVRQELSTTAASTVTAPSEQPGVAAVLSRGQKAAATRAANRAGASSGAAEPAGASAQPLVEQLFRLAGTQEENHAVLVRIATALEELVALVDKRVPF